MSDVLRQLEAQVAVLAEQSDEDLRVLLMGLERAYIHTLIEQGLRQGVSVSLQQNDPHPVD
jgi:hypothetical protein